MDYPFISRSNAKDLLHPQDMVFYPEVQYQIQRTHEECNEDVQFIPFDALKGVAFWSSSARSPIIFKLA
jgi:hypothetical protein